MSQWAGISSIAQGYLILVSFAFIGYEIYQSVELTKAANSQALAEQAGNFNSLLIQDRDVAKIWYSHGRGLEEPQFVEITGRERYRELLVQWLILHENIFYQQKKRLLDPLIYNGWLADLKRTLSDHDISVLSSDLEELFPGEFGKHLNELQEGL